MVLSLLRTSSRARFHQGRTTTVNRARPDSGQFDDGRQTSRWRRCRCDTRNSRILARAYVAGVPRCRPQLYHRGRWRRLGPFVVRRCVVCFKPLVRHHPSVVWGNSGEPRVVRKRSQRLNTKIISSAKRVRIKAIKLTISTEDTQCPARHPTSGPQEYRLKAPLESKITDSPLQCVSQSWRIAYRPCSPPLRSTPTQSRRIPMDAVPDR